MTPVGAADGEASLRRVVAALGVAQIVSWGTLFYTVAVLGQAMRAASGVDEVVFFGCYTAGLVVSGLVAPWVGRLIDARGGRVVLAAGSVLAAVACLALAAAQGIASLLVAWTLAGVAMAATLYDPAFATLHQVAGLRYRRAVTALTLFGGFASTVFWPLSQVLLDAWGFRATFVAYAALHLVVCLPLHWWALPRGAKAAAPRAEARAADTTVPAGGRVFAWLATALVGASFAAGALSAHLIDLLTGSGMGARDAVLIGALVGPMQVAGRVLEFGFARRVTPIAVGTIAFGALAAALVLLPGIGAGFAAAAAFAALYGFSNGVLTIVRGTVPAELFGGDRYGALLGRLAKPQVLARAVAPAAFAGLVALDPGRTLALGALAACGVLSFLAYRRAVAR